MEGEGRQFPKDNSRLKKCGGVAARKYLVPVGGNGSGGSGNAVP
jgi:hypothetical protein